MELTFGDFETATEATPGDKTGKSPKPCEVSKADKAYQPGKPLSLATDRAYTIELPIQPSFWYQVTMVAVDAADVEDDYILESDDGAYKIRRSVDRDHVRGTTARALEFPCIYEGPLYSLFHESTGDLPRYEVFSKRSFASLLQASHWFKRARRSR